MSDSAEPLCVYRNEPLMRLAEKYGLGSFGLVVLYFCLIGPLLIGASVSRACRHPCLPFWHNISWSISLLYIFPFVIWLTSRYYEQIPRLFERLYALVENRNEPDVRRFNELLEQRFNDNRLPALILFVTLVLNGIYFWQTLNDPRENSWITGGTLFQSYPRHGLSPLGAYAAFVQVVLLYWVLSVIAKGFVLAWALHDFFNHRGFEVRMEPLHPDRCCGLRPLAHTVSLLNYILFLLGIYLSLKALDKIVIQKLSLLDDIGNPAMLGAYVILAPLLFFFSLGSAHGQMRDAKDRFIVPISRRCETLFHRLGSVNLDDTGRATIESYAKMQEMRNAMQREIPVWPFDFKSIQAFFGAIVVPLLPVLLPLVAGWLAVGR